MQENQNFFQRLLRGLWKITKAYLIGVGLFWTAVPILFGILVYFSIKKQEELQPVTEVNRQKEQAILELKLDGVIEDGLNSKPSHLLQRLFDLTDRVYLLDFIGKIHQAKEDPLISGFFIQIDNFSASKNQIREIRQALFDFKESGKEIWCWTSYLETDSFLLGSVCNRLNMSPAGSVDLVGPAFRLMYFGEALKKVGVGIDVLRAGSFKNAFEPLVSNEPSAETLEMYRWLEADIRSTILRESLINSRFKLSEDQLREWFRKSLYTAIEAKGMGIVNDLMPMAETKKAFRESLPKEKQADFEDFSDYVFENNNWNLLDASKKSIAYIDLQGDIDLNGSNNDGKSIVPQSVEEDLTWSLENDDVAAILIRIDSPGGSALASDMIWSSIKAANERKPVIVSMGSMAASGGYYIASAARKIIADPFTITGSIGVIGLMTNFSQFQEKYGVSFHTVTSSDRKTIVNPGKSLSEDDRKILNHGIDETYELFLRRVSESRGLQRNEVHELAQGKVWTGKQALGLKLVDQLGGLKEALAEAKTAAGLDPNKLYPLVSPQSDFDTAECILNSFNVRRCLSKGSRTDLGNFMGSVQNLLPWQKKLLGDPEDLETILQILKSSRSPNTQARLIGVTLK